MPLRARAETAPDRTRADERSHAALLVSTFAIAACGLVYELLAGTVSSYLLGDSVYQFSIVIGLFMAAMGLGSYLSRYIGDALADSFVLVQLALGAGGGLSALALFFAFTLIENYTPVLVVLSVVIGSLVGVEIPLLIRMLREYRVLKVSVSNVLTLDYAGALVASVLFPIVLVPQLGLVETALFFGLLNVLVAGLALHTLRERVRRPGRLTVAALIVAAGLGAAWVSAHRLTSAMESRLYAADVIYSETTPYQRIVITRDGAVISLFVNGGLQFNSLDEYRYHEALVHPAMALARRHSRVLVLGGGDGLAVREILKYADVEAVTVVDIDPTVTRLFASNPLLRRLNHDALRDPRVSVVNADAAKFLERSGEVYDVALVDLPDPSDIGTSRLYTRWFYSLVASRLAVEGVLVTQATSPLYAREAFWCIERTVASAASPHVAPPGQPGARLHTVPYHVYVPTFGEWGFVLAASRPPAWERIGVSVPTRYLRPEALESMRRFPPDMARVEVEANTLQSHRLTRYYEQGWARWYR